MLTLTCPCCGVTAEETELHPGGEAHLKRHGPGSTDEDFEGYMFSRKNQRGIHFERWRHAYGCGKWFLAARDSATLQVFGTYPAQTARPPAALIDAIRDQRPGWTPDWTDAPAAPEKAESGGTSAPANAPPAHEGTAP